MAINLAKFSKRQISSVIVLIILVVVFIILMVLVMKPAKTTIRVPMKTISPPEINFSVLQNPVLLRLELFPQTPDMTTVVGRSNPFGNLSTTTATSIKK